MFSVLMNLKRCSLFVLVTILTLIVSLQDAAAQNGTSQTQSPEYYKITSFTFEQIEDEDTRSSANPFLDYENDCSKSDGLNVSVKPKFDSTTNPFRDGTAPVLTNPVSVGLAQADIILDQIVNIGSKIWTIFKNSRPVVNLHTATASALPKGLQCWNQLEYWQPPRSEVYRATYKNLFGFEVVRMDVRVMYAFGGRFEGKGRYITNATVQYRDVQVAPGGLFELNANVAVPMVLNIGSSVDPVAALQMDLNWTVKGINEIQQAASFVVFGDGRKTEVHN